MVEDGAIAYWSALNYHGLTEQFPNIVFVQTRRKKRNKRVFGVAYMFVKVPDRKYLGISTEGFGNHRFLITEPEKTLVDCFDLIKYSGGYAELIRAFTRYPSNSDKLIDFSAAVDNLAAIKRMGYLSEMFWSKKLSKFINFARSKVNPKYNLFDPYGYDQGEFVKEWKLRLNIRKEDILEITQQS